MVSGAKKETGGQVFKDLLSLYCNLPHKTEILQKICLFSVFLKTSWPYEPFYVMKIHQVALLPGHEMDDNNISQRDFCDHWKILQCIQLGLNLRLFHSGRKLNLTSRKKYSDLLMS